MRGLNKHFFFPSGVIACILVASVALDQQESVGAQANSSFELENVIFLPVIPDKQEVFQEETLVSISSPAATQIEKQIPDILNENGAAPSILSEPSIPTNRANVNLAAPTAEPQQEKTIDIQLVIDGPGGREVYDLSGKQGETVYQALKQASKKFDFSIKFSQHASLGIFVEGIVGVENNPTANRYWLYYLNGQFASRGVSLQTLQDGDKIEWKYE